MIHNHEEHVHSTARLGGLVFTLRDDFWPQSLWATEGPSVPVALAASTMKVDFDSVTPRPGGPLSEGHGPVSAGPGARGPGMSLRLPASTIIREPALSGALGSGRLGPCLVP